MDIEGQELEAIKGSKDVLLNNKNIKIIFELNIANNSSGIKFAIEIFDDLKRLNFSNFEALLEPKIVIKDLNNPSNVEILKKITDRHNINILASRWDYFFSNIWEIILCNELVYQLLRRNAL